ncbi:Protein of unknown function [Loktanella fryxellensis]|uniref:DUF2796 domain-containing protein n=1 Tax=Loktanella fryxellensis TaxID=245187 RepID=A0A1H8A6R5_9RHOB|nr:DUF2796 domain-containing protein [Loktanella fryxellensis]SEM66253.1 Protein of unknown function [Loktanella fryxellensis]
MTRLGLAMMAALTAAPALAQDTRELDAHVHGTSTLDLAVDGGIVTMDLTAPGMDIVGFEYPASTGADKDAVATAIAALLQADRIAALPEEAGCRLTEAAAHLDGGDHDHDHDADHATETSDAHDHAEDAANAHDHDHADDHAAEGDGHTAFHATYAFDCDAPDALDTITFPFFDTFAGAMQIEAQYVTATGAGSAAITRDAATLTLN